MRKLELGLTSLQLIAMGRGVRGGQALVPLYFGGRRCINRCTKSFRPCPISPTVADYCRRIRLIPLRPASELPTVTAEVASSSLVVPAIFLKHLQLGCCLFWVQQGCNRFSCGCQSELNRQNSFNQFLLSFAFSCGSRLQSRTPPPEHIWIVKVAGSALSVSSARPTGGRGKLKPDGGLRRHYVPPGQTDKPPNGET